MPHKLPYPQQRPPWTTLVYRILAPQFQLLQSHSLGTPAPQISTQTLPAATFLTTISSCSLSSSPFSSPPIATSHVVAAGKPLVCKDPGDSFSPRICKAGLGPGDGSIPDGGLSRGSKDWTKGERHRRLTCRRGRQRRMQRVVVGLQRVRYRCRTCISRQITKRERALGLQGRG